MPVQILLDQVSKKINYQTIYQGISADMHSGRTYGIQGPNGSGKSTLLQGIMGYDSISSGTVKWILDGQDLPQESYFHHYSFSAPYAEIIEDFTVINFLKFVSSRWPLDYSQDVMDELLELFELGIKKNTSIHKLSSGQKQKVNLIQSMASSKPVLILDEPTSFLDHKSIDVFKELLESQRHKLIIIASNVDHDFPTNTEYINLS